MAILDGKIQECREGALLGESPLCWDEQPDLLVLFKTDPERANRARKLKLSCLGFHSIGYLQCVK